MTGREEGGCHPQERLARQCPVLPRWAGWPVPRFGGGGGGGGSLGSEFYWLGDLQ